MNLLLTLLLIFISCVKMFGAKFYVPPPPFKPLNKTHNALLNRTKIHVGAIVPYILTYDRFMFHSAMYTALRLVNDEDTILKDYELVIDYKDSTTLVGFSYLMFYQLVEQDPVEQLLIGPAFAKTTKAIAEMTTRFKIPQISYSTLQKFGSSDTPDDHLVGGSISERHFPYLVKATPSLVSFNEAMVKLFQHFKWRRIAILYEYSAQQFFSTAYDLSLRLKKVGIEAEIIQGFSSFFSTVDAQLKLLEEKDIRVIFGIFGTKGARRIFCEAYHRNLYGPKYQWITVSTLKPEWWHPVAYIESTNCTTEQYLTASKGYMTIAKTTLRKDDIKIIGNKTAAEIWKVIKEQKDYVFYNQKAVREIVSDETYEIVEESTFAFDAVLLAARSLDNVLKTKGEAGLLAHYYDEKKASYITEVLLNSSFEGITGRLQYGGNSYDERQGDIRIQQFEVYANRTEGVRVDIGNFNIASKEIRIFVADQDLFEEGRVIKDRKTINRIPRTYSLRVISILWGLATAGAVLCIAVLFINLKYRNIRMIKMSSPNINNGIIAGSLVCYVSVIFYGLDSRFLSTAGIGVACNAVTITLSIGFTLSFGCLFSKTWRIYKIFTAAKTMEKVSIKDTHLYFIIAGLICLDVCVFIIWVLVSPFSVEEIELEHVVYPDLDKVDSYFYHKCSCQYQLHFTVAMYGYKGFLLIFGLFLAWETRNVKVAVLNDSKYIGMAVYNVCVVSAVGVICASSLYNTNHFTTGYLVVTISVFLCTTATLLLIFVPKVYLLFGKSYDITYGNVSVRGFSTSLAVRKTRKQELADESSHSTNISNQSGSCIYRCSTDSSDLYSQNRFNKSTVTKCDY